jgi:hypothetical protein
MIRRAAVVTACALACTAAAEPALAVPAFLNRLSLQAPATATAQSPVMVTASGYAQSGSLTLQAMPGSAACPASVPSGSGTPQPVSGFFQTTLPVTPTPPVLGAWTICGYLVDPNAEQGWIQYGPGQPLIPVGPLVTAAVTVTVTPLPGVALAASPGAVPSPAAPAQLSVSDRRSVTISDLRWLNWGRSVAFATGTVARGACGRACRSRTSRSVPATVAVFAPRLCGDRMAYTRATLSVGSAKPERVGLSADCAPAAATAGGPAPRRATARSARR